MAPLVTQRRTKATQDQLDVSNFSPKSWQGFPKSSLASAVNTLHTFRNYYAFSACRTGDSCKWNRVINQKREKNALGLPWSKVATWQKNRGSGLGELGIVGLWGPPGLIALTGERRYFAIEKKNSFQFSFSSNLHNTVLINPNADKPFFLSCLYYNT